MWLDAKFLSIRGRLSCYQQSRPFESWIPSEALPTLNQLSFTGTTEQLRTANLLVKLSSGRTEHLRIMFDESTCCKLLYDEIE